MIRRAAPGLLISAFAFGSVLLLGLVLGCFVGRATATVPYSWAPPPDSLFRDVATPRPAALLGEPRPTGAPRAGTFEEPAPRSVRAIGAVPSEKGGDAGLTTDRSDTMPRRSPSTTTAAGRLFGVASWGWFDGHVVTRLPRGTRIEICGVESGRCWSGESWGYGPDPDIHPERIADMDVRWWWHVCQRDPSAGLCDVTLETLR